MSKLFALPCELRILLRTRPLTQARCYSRSIVRLDQPRTPPSRRTGKHSKALLDRRKPLQPQRYQDGTQELPGQDSPSRDTKELVSRAPSEVGPHRRSEVPVRVLPKAKISRDVTLTPRQRMEVEYLTRKAPRPVKQRLFRDRLLIYHAGMSAKNGLLFSKFFTLLWASVTSAVIAPAYYVYGDPWWKVAGIVVCGIAPALTLHWSTKGFVNWIYLLLPTHARQTSKTAMHYAKNLPANARLLINSQRLHMVDATADVSMAEIVPYKRTFPPSTFRVVPRAHEPRKGPWFSPDPLVYYVRSQTATHGKAVKDTVPGIWEHVYKSIMCVESEAAGRWKK